MTSRHTCALHGREVHCMVEACIVGDTRAAATQTSALFNRVRDLALTRPQRLFLSRAPCMPAARIPMVPARTLYRSRALEPGLISPPLLIHGRHAG